MNKKLYATNILIMSLVLLSTSLAYADDTIVGASGHTVFPLSTDKIQMVSEKVKIKMESYYVVKDTAILTRRAFVTCKFVFKNISNHEIKAKVGFPGDIYSWSDAVDVPDLNNFVAYVDKHPVKIQIKKEIVSKEPNYGEDYRNWYTWDVTFPPLKTITVRNSYWVTLSSDQETNWFEYILITGANWAGNIGKALIEIIYPNEQELKMFVKEIKPDGYKIIKNNIYWEFKNFKPKENIKIIEKNYRGLNDFRK
jgi:hypothetical protein